jgi:hypothetical protein
MERTTNGTGEAESAAPIRTAHQAARAFARLHGLEAGRRTREHTPRETETRWVLSRAGVPVGSLVLTVNGSRLRWYGELQARADRGDGIKRVLAKKELVWPSAYSGSRRADTEQRLRWAFMREVSQMVAKVAAERSYETRTARLSGASDAASWDALARGEQHE